MEKVVSNERIICGAGVWSDLQPKEPIPLLPGLDLTFDGNNVITISAGAIVNKDIKDDPAFKFVDIITSADAGFADKPEATHNGVITFLYKPKGSWSKQVITIHDIEFSLFQNTTSIGITGNKVTFSFLTKVKTSDSKTFYEDLIGERLDQDDIKALMWLLAVGSNITGRQLNEFDAHSSTERGNASYVFSKDYLVRTTKSLTPKLAIITSKESEIVLSLNTIKSGVIHKQDDIIDIILSTQGNMEWILAMV